MSYPLLAFPDGDSHFPDAPNLDTDQYYGLPHDDDLGAVYPASFPKDPFPEVLFADRSFDRDLFDDGTLDDGGVHDRGTTPGWLLPAADLTADGAGLIGQVRGYENVKCWAAGQQARLSVAFEARLRQESTDRPPLAAEDLGKDRGKDRDLGGRGRADRLGPGRVPKPRRAAARHV